jgi:NAD(P)-dependent dehydrogenase (short-subunit alcohol dehydrogenase family)
MITALLTALTVLWKSFLAFLRCFQRITISDPENHLVVITGCDSGFGLMTTEKLLKQKYYVVPLCLTEKGVAELEEYCKSNGFTRCLPLRCDVTKEEDVKRVYGRVEELLKEKKGLKMWALVNNAGIAPGGFLDWTSMATFRRTMEVNYFAVVLMTKTFLELLKRSKYSRIINISSTAGSHNGFAHGCPYASSKHAVEGLAKSLRQELFPWNIFVCNINPGIMK